MKTNIKIFLTNEIQFLNILQLKHYIKNENNLVIISEKKVYSLYPELFKNNSPQLILPISEHAKALHTAEKIWHFLLKQNVTKSHKICIIGGGVLHDITCFACSVFKRGISFVSVPTTLLSMVDASIGGKNAVNMKHTKNILGTIALPLKNIIVPEFLHTLSKEQLLSGWAEIIKIALVKDQHFYHTIIKHLHHSLIPDKKHIQQAIQLKLKIIQKDLNDQNERQLLNYGHTIGHAIEGLLEERKKYIPHGYAVAYGIIAENQMAVKLKKLNPKTATQIEQDILQHFSTRYLSEINPSDIPLLTQKILQDKKNTAKTIHFSLIEGIGKGSIKIPVALKTIQWALKYLSSFKQN